ncbi:hypothetical protein IEQ11_11140 [Lysobacter capsici]|uniref:hypothetical protein n=1 Tax=Lysobacter capsici TaxID=435897 RepID=UPI00177D6996|nr:hypothetical protein [Lysobacter capsici]UOF17140.1 hypothetical protein IEQ11_11140 [Lysobacter capsici]
MKSTFARRTVLLTAIALFGFSATVFAACQSARCGSNYKACITDARADGEMTDAEYQHCFQDWSDCLVANGCQAP